VFKITFCVGDKIFIDIKLFFIFLEIPIKNFLLAKELENLIQSSSLVALFEIEKKVDRNFLLTFVVQISEKLIKNHKN